MRTLTPKNEAIARFWSRVDVQDDDDCWNWTWGKYTDGYGQFYGAAAFGREAHTHRQSFFLDRGRWPHKGLCVLHRCHNPTCVNPKHLYEGTIKQNVADAVAARDGRHWSGGPSHYRKLDESQVREIRALWDEGNESQRQIAKKFGVSQTAVRKIIHRKTWRHVI